MEIIKPNSAFLCNYEVMQILQQLKDNTQKKHKREGSLATVTYETVHYLQDTECKNQSAEKIEGFLEAMKSFKLTKSEKLMMVNTPPRTELEIQLLGAIFYGAKCPTEKQRQGVEDAYSVLEAYLHNSYLACDHMTIADIGAATTTNALQVSHRLDENKFPRTVNWLARMNEHPPFKKINVPGLAMYTQVMKSCWEKNQQAET